MVLQLPWALLKSCSLRPSQHRDPVEKSVAVLHEDTEEAAYMQMLERNLYALPPAILGEILRRAGHRCRRVCRQWRHAYGPAGSNSILHIEANRRTLSDLAPLLSQIAPKDLHPKITTLILSGDIDPHKPLPNLQDLPSNTPQTDPSTTSTSLAPLLALLPTTLPHLASLSTANLSLLSPTPFSLPHCDLTLLTPLIPTLTALHITLSADSPLNPLLPNPLALFSSLRTLHLTHLPPNHHYTIFTDPTPTPPSWTAALLSSLSTLPHLHTLSLSHSPTSTFPSTPYLLHLPLATPHLTSLALLQPLSSFNPPALHALATSLPSLSALTLLLPGSSSPHGPALYSSLSLRTALTSLTLHPAFIWSSFSPDLHPLSRLTTLRSLSLTAPFTLTTPPTDLQSFLTTLTTPLTYLTHLQLHSWIRTPSNPHTRRTPHPTITPPLTLPPTLCSLTLCTIFDPPLLVACLTSLAHLTSLRLTCTPPLTPLWDVLWTPDWTRQHGSQLRHLTSLRKLEVEEQEPLILGILQALPSLPHLHHLSLTACAAWGSPPVDPASQVTDSDLEHLKALRHTLAHLSLQGLRQVAGPGLAAVRKLAALQELSLKDIPAGRRLPRYLLPLPVNLESICLQDVQLTDSGRRAVMADPSLKHCRYMRVVCEWPMMRVN